MSSSSLCSTRLQGSIIGRGRGYAADALPSAGSGRNFEFGHGAGDSLPTLRDGHHGIFDVHKLMLADGPSV